MVVINEAPTFQNKQVQTQSRVRESIGFLIYDKTQFNANEHTIYYVTTFF